jgi:hypothetical protein
MLTSTIEVCIHILQPLNQQNPLGRVRYMSLVYIPVEERCFIYSTIISQYVIIAKIIHMTKSGPITASLYIVGYYYLIISRPQILLFDDDQLG